MPNQVSIVMKRLNVVLKSCTKTMGKPFEGENAKCPLYNQLDEHLSSDGWTQKHFNSINTGIMDHCDLRYEKVEKRKVEGNREEVLYALDIIIDGSSRSCDLKAHVDTFLASNKVASISHDSEIDVLKGLEVAIAH